MKGQIKFAYNFFFIAIAFFNNIRDFARMNYETSYNIFIFINYIGI